MDLENMTAKEYLAAKVRSKTSGTEQVAFREMRKQLRTTPKVQERLLFQLLSVTQDALETEGSPRGSLADALQFIESLTQENIPEYVDRIQKIASDCSRLIEKADAATGDYLALESTLAVCLTELHRRAPDRFKLVWQNLGYPKGRRSKLLDKVAARI